MISGSSSFIIEIAGIFELVRLPELGLHQWWHQQDNNDAWTLKFVVNYVHDNQKALKYFKEFSNQWVNKKSSSLQERSRRRCSISNWDFTAWKSAFHFSLARILSIHGLFLVVDSGRFPSGQWELFYHSKQQLLFEETNHNQLLRC